VGDPEVGTRCPRYPCATIVLTLLWVRCEFFKDQRNEKGASGGRPCRVYVAKATARQGGQPDWDRSRDDWYDPARSGVLPIVHRQGQDGIELQQCSLIYTLTQDGETGGSGHGGGCLGADWLPLWSSTRTVVRKSLISFFGNTKER
jgi:hypothetical protein